jgi:hypothetical protein
MDAKDFRRIALSMEGAEEGSHMGAESGEEGWGKTENQSEETW